VTAGLLSLKRGAVEKLRVPSRPSWLVLFTGDIRRVKAITTKDTKDHEETLYSMSAPTASAQ